MRRRVRSIAVLVLVLGWIAGGASPAEARDSPARKLGRGFANLGLGVMTLPAEVVDTGRRHGPFVGATWGLVKGVTLTAVTEVVGVWEVLTAPYPFPPDFKPILSPEFPWQRFEAESRQESLEPPPRVR
jgi:putative exosortase-associated protein (TIGR04073 family)